MLVSRLYYVEYGMDTSEDDMRDAVSAYLPSTHRSGVVWKYHTTTATPGSTRTSPSVSLTWGRGTHISAGQAPRLIN